jgi:pimeloyl-ACP methyl ester carboxylesterase
MFLIRWYAVFLLLVLGACTGSRRIAGAFAIYEDSLILVDTVRNRSIPLALYLPVAAGRIPHQQVVIFSHGYNANEPGANRSYTYLTRYLAAHGYAVVSIQHELPGDSLLPTTGIPQVVRRTNWERGVMNIRYVMEALPGHFPQLDYSHLTLIGHSNGGDMSMLFGHLHPQLVHTIISLDNRRMPLPRTTQPRIYSLRADEFPADEGVIPPPSDLLRYGIHIVLLKGVKHNDMSDSGKPRQHRKINRQVLEWLEPEGK